MNRHAFLVLALAGCTVPWTEDPAEADRPATELEPGSDPPVEDSDASLWDSTPLRADDTGEAPPPDDPPPQASWADGSRPANTCAAARRADPVGTGRFTGSLRGFTGSGLVASCIRFATYGPDAFHKVLVPAGATLEVTFEAFGEDSQVYLLSDCDSGRSCIEGSDRGVHGDAEDLAYTNTTAYAQVGYLVLAAFDPDADPDAFELRIQLR